jgi:hypothetical protein
MSYTTKYGGAVYLSFGSEMITLTAADITKPRFSYKAESFYTAISLGTIQEAITTLLTKFDSVVGGIVNVADIKSQIDSLKDTIPPLAIILNSELVVTEFTVQPETEPGKADGHYAFGFGLRTSATQGVLGPAKLDGISFSVILDQTAS